LKHVFVAREPEMDSAFECKQAYPWDMPGPLDTHTILVISNPGVAVKVGKKMFDTIVSCFKSAVTLVRFNSFVSCALSKLGRQMEIVAHKGVGFLMENIVVYASGLFADLEGIVSCGTAGFSRRAEQSCLSFGWVFDFVTDCFLGPHRLIISEVHQIIKREDMRVIPAWTNGVSHA